MNQNFEGMKKMTEEVKFTDSWPGYKVTKCGRVFSVNHNWRGYGRREMKQELNYYGYPSVRLTVGGLRKRICVHRIVADAWISKKPGKDYEIRHLDGNRTNNHFKNLSWGTAKDNAADRNIHGKTSRGKCHGEAIKNSNHKQRVREYHAERKNNDKI